MSTVLLASAARLVAASPVIGPTIVIPDGAVLFGMVAQLTVSAASTDAGDTLDVYIQHSVDDGTTWDDLIHFTQVLGNGGAKKYIARWAPWTGNPESEIGAPNDAAMSAGVLQQPGGRLLRCKAVIVDADADGSFTFGVTADIYRAG